MALWHPPCSTDPDRGVEITSPRASAAGWFWQSFLQTKCGGSLVSLLFQLVCKHLIDRLALLSVAMWFLFFKSHCRVLSKAGWRGKPLGLIKKSFRSHQPSLFFVSDVASFRLDESGLRMPVKPSGSSQKSSDSKLGNMDWGSVETWKLQREYSRFLKTSPLPQKLMMRAHFWAWCV